MQPGHHSPVTPFWVKNRQTPGFFSAAELRIGDHLSLCGDGAAVVTGIRSELCGKDAEFTTYNFAVQDYNTYFAGFSGVWVHNTGSTWCARLALAMDAKIADLLKVLAAGTDAAKVRFRAISEIVAAAASSYAKCPAILWGKSLCRTGIQIVEDFNAGKLPLAEFPVFRDWRKLQEKLRGFKGMDIHHLVEQYILRLIGVDTAKLLVAADGTLVRLGDLVPSLPLPRNLAWRKLMYGKETLIDLEILHKGVDGTGISSLLQTRIPTGGGGMSPSDILVALRKLHLEKPELRKLWPAMRAFLVKLKADGHLASDVVIPPL